MLSRLVTLRCEVTSRGSKIKLRRYLRRGDWRLVVQRILQDAADLLCSAIALLPFVWVGAVCIGLRNVEG